MDFVGTERRRRDGRSSPPSPPLLVTTTTTIAISPMRHRSSLSPSLLRSIFTRVATTTLTLLIKIIARYHHHHIQRLSHRKRYNEPRRDAAGVAVTVTNVRYILRGQPDAGFALFESESLNLFVLQKSKRNEYAKTISQRLQGETVYFLLLQPDEGGGGIRSLRKVEETDEP
ncbi:hypothetical protein Bca4012_058335 [Brassica carinata]